MQFVHRIRTIWSWLPSFRAVGETEHLPTAAGELGVVPSSLSRMVKQLEDELGIPLFDRTTKLLVLNDAGRTLLAAVREAMRVVDDALALASGDDLRGNVGAVATGDLVHAILLPACATLLAAHPALTVTTRVASASEAPELLVRGDADAAILFAPVSDPELRSVELASWSRGVYARRGRSAGIAERCVVVGTPADHADDGWPPVRDRVVAAWSPDERSALELCARSDLATVAFDAVAATHPGRDRLERIDGLEVEPRALYLVHRRAVGHHRRTDALVDAIRAALSTT